MIYFLDNDLELQKIVTSENINRAQHEDEKNNLKMMTLEMDLAYAKSFLNDDIDHFGYYVKDAFHVAKIRRVEESHDGETLTVIGHHIFFSDMIYGRLVEDVRPVNRDAAFILNQTIGANTRWHPVITDTTGILSTNFYWTTPMEVVEFLVENFRLEFEPEILFDGQKVNGLNIHFKKRLGEDKPKRVVYGPNTPTLEYNIDYSEIVTKLAVHGKGEEVGDGYGRRINFSDRNINRDGVISPLGSRYLEDPNVTANYGNFNNEPKHANVIFEDIENVNELIEAGIEEYERLSRPQYIFTATVADIGDVNIGDSVLIVRREYGIYFRARVHKISVDLLNPQDAEVVLGDYEHFKETKVERSARRQRESNERAINSRITQLKNAFDARFDGEVAQMRDDYEQALIDAHAEIAAAEQRMQELLDTERAEFNERFDTEMQAAYDEAERNYNLIDETITNTVDSTRTELITAFEASVEAAEQRAEQEYLEIRDEITNTVDTARDDMMQEFESQVSDTREFAQQQAELNANAVREDLSETTSQHNQMIQDLQADVIDFDEFRTDTNTHVQEIANHIGTIDDFLGDLSSITLDERLQNINRNFEERIRNVDSNTFNMLRESRFDNLDFVGTSGGRIEDDESIPYYKNTVFSVMAPWVSPTETVTLESGKEYILSFDFKSESVPEADYVWFTAYDDGGNRNLFLDSIENTLYNLPTDGEWRRVYIRFTAWRGATGRIRIGSRFSVGDTDVGEFRIRLPYLTSSSNTEWVYHPLDATQSIEEVTRRITNLEDGRNELITRTEWDSESDYIMQTVKDIEETVDVSRNLIQEIENYEIILRGSEAIQTVDGFQDKVWLNDFAEIGANLIPMSSNAWEDGTFWSSGSNNNNSGGIRTKDYIEVIPGERYTFQDESLYVSAISEVQIAQWDGDTRIGITAFVNRRNSRSFTVQGDRIRIGLTPMSGFGIQPRYIDHLDERIKMKLEKGDSATPFMNALSRVEQLADSFSVQIAELDGNYVTQSQFNVTAGEVDTLVSKTDGYDTEIGKLSVSYDEISATVVSINKDVESYGTWINQTDDLITSKVWMNDVADINANLIPFTDFTVSGNSDFWTRYGSNAFAVTDDGYYRARNTNSSGFISIETPSFDVVEGQEYTVSFKGSMSSNIGRTNFDRTYNLGAGVGSISAGTAYHQGDGVYRYRFTAKGTGSQSVVIGVWTPSGRDVSIYIKEVKVEEGSVMTPYMRAMSVVDQMANEIRLAVQGIDGYGYLTQSDIQVRPGHVQLGSQRLGDDELASIIRVSPDTIDAITSEMRLNGDLLVEGEITALAVKAIEGEFASLWADEFEAITIKVGDIEGVTAEFERMYILNANIEKLVSQDVFAEEVTALSVSAIDGRFGSLFAAEFEAITIDVEDISGRTAWFEEMIVNRAVVDELVSDVHFSDEITSKAISAIDGRFGSLFAIQLETTVLESKHIGTNTIKADMLDVDSAMINKLLTDTILSDKITSISIESVYADLRKVDSEIMTSNIIKSNWLDVDNALIERVYLSDAFIENAEIKAANIRDLDAITINANQITLTTLRNRVNQIEGGLNIVRPDGATWVQNGVPRGNIPVQIFDSYSDDEVGFTGLNFYTQSSHWKTFKYFYTPHEGRTLRIAWAVGLYDGPSNIEYMEVRARNFSSYSPLNNGSGTSTRRVTLNRGETTFITQDIPMNAPNYTLNAAYLEFRRAPDGQSSNNRVYARILHIGQYG